MGQCATSANGQNQDSVQTKILAADAAHKGEEEAKSLLSDVVVEKEDRGYLDFPRIHFYGKFRANPSTGNNAIADFRTAMLCKPGTAENKIVAENKHVVDGKTINGQWNYKGDMTWSFTECNVTAAYDTSGDVDTKTFEKFQINPSMMQASGRINDLDPWQQMISHIWGFKVKLCDSSNNNICLLSSDFDPASFQNLWGRATPQNGSTKARDEVMSCNWTSILKNCQFGEDNELSNYKVLRELKEYSQRNGNKLQIKFVVDGFNGDGKNVEVFTYGRVYGFIGCYSDGNPTKCLKYARYLYPKGAMYNPPRAQGLPAMVGGGAGQFLSLKTVTTRKKDQEKEHKLVIEVSNCIPTGVENTNSLNSSTFDPFNLKIGDIVVYKHENNGKIEIARIKEHDYHDKSQWRVNCGIFVRDISEKDRNDIAENSVPVTVAFTNTENIKTYHCSPELSELQYGFYANCESVQIRMGTVGTYEPKYFGKEYEIETYVSIYGQPLDTTQGTGQHASLGLDIKARKVINWAPPPEGPNHKPPPIPPSVTNESNPNFKFEITNLDSCKDGRLKFKVRAPDTLEDSTTKELPRAQWYMDSFVWNLLFHVTMKNDNNGNNGNSDTVLAVTNVSETDVLVENDPPAHGHYPGWKGMGSSEQDEKYQGGLMAHAQMMKAHAKMPDSDGTIVQAKHYNGLFVFMASACIFNEIEQSKLPAVPRWQPGIATDLTDVSWKDFLDSDEYSKEHVPYIHPIFRQYANLYPIMSQIVNLDDYREVTYKLSALRRAFNEPFESVYYMPITRDLSGMKQVVIKEWLQNPVFCDAFVDHLEAKGGFFGPIKDVNTLIAYLQAALELELSTLPPYLSALYSIDPSMPGNEKIIKLITSIVHQEMQHFALVCNLMLAIGATPRIAFKDVARRTEFPRKGLVSKISNGDLSVPAVLGKLVLELGPMSREGADSAMDTFMKIEAPCNFQLIEDIKQKSVVADNTKNLKKKVIYMKNGSSSGGSSEKTDEMDEKDDNGQKLHVLFSMLQSASGQASGQDGANNVSENKEDKEVGMEWLDDLVSDGHGGKLASHHGIGAFYQLIRKGFVYLVGKLGENVVFKVNNENDCIYDQIGNLMIEGVNYVYSLQSALAAVDTIVSEGEGTSITDIWSDDSNLSHFHKFLEIKVGYSIVGAKRVGIDHEHHAIYEYIFAKNSAEKINFNEKGVQSDEKAWNWLKYSPDGSGGSNDTSTNANAKDIRVINFNETYAKLLRALQEMCGGVGSAKRNKYGKNATFSEVKQQRAREVAEAIGLMRQLQVDFSQCLRPYTMPGVSINTKDNNTYDAVAPNWVPPPSMMFD